MLIDERTTAERGLLKSPFPYMGGKSTVAPLVWSRFGNVPNFVEPFFGSGAMLLARPHEPGIETCNDADGLLSNTWRAMKHDPDGVAYYADDMPDECSLHARHLWLVGHRESITDQLMGDPEWFDVKAAGYWLYGICLWIGGGWCSGKGPWIEQDGRMVDSRGVAPSLSAETEGVIRQLPHLGDAGQGVKRQLLHLGDAGRGVKRGSSGSAAVYEYLRDIADRLRRVRVCCGDWSRVCGPTPTIYNGLTAVFLDPPYSAESGREANLYAKESLTVAHDVRAWCVANGDNPLLRIAICGYAGEGHEELDALGWECVAWKAQGGYGGQGNGQGRENATKERIWFSKGCLKPQLTQNGSFDL